MPGLARLQLLGTAYDDAGSTRTRFDMAPDAHRQQHGSAVSGDRYCDRLSAAPRMHAHGSKCARWPACATLVRIGRAQATHRGQPSLDPDRTRTKRELSMLLTSALSPARRHTRHSGDIRGRTDGPTPSETPPAYPCQRRTSACGSAWCLDCSHLACLPMMLAGLPSCMIR